jgi:hypothetical protein
MWYGFAYLNNPYDSVSFRLKPQGRSVEDALPGRLEEMLFEGYYGGPGLVRGMPHLGGVVTRHQLTREFRLKRGAFPAPLLEFLRIYLAEGYARADLYRLQATQPTSYPFEALALFSLLYLLEHKLSTFSTTASED